MMSSSKIEISHHRPALQSHPLSHSLSRVRSLSSLFIISLSLLVEKKAQHFRIANGTGMKKMALGCTHTHNRLIDDRISPTVFPRFTAQPYNDDSRALDSWLSTIFSASFSAPKPCNGTERVNINQTVKFVFIFHTQTQTHTHVHHHKTSEKDSMGVAADVKHYYVIPIVFFNLILSTLCFTVVHTLLYGCPVSFAHSQLKFFLPIFFPFSKAHPLHDTRTPHTKLHAVN